MIEHGSELAVELWETGLRASSNTLCYPEGRAALGAARRAGRLAASSYRHAVDDFEALHDELQIIGIDDTLARHGGRLADDLGLRGYDAVHLASALALGEDTVLVTWDKPLGQAAASVGCAVAPAT